jgi:hypothetical protein
VRNKIVKEENKEIFGGAVYCKETGNGIKIGSSMNPNQRLNTHRNTYGNGKSYVSGCYANYIEIECHIHKKLKEKRLHGEHFDISFNEAEFHINESCSDIGVIANKFVDERNSKMSYENGVKIIQYIDEKTKDKNINNTCTIIEWCESNKIKMSSFELLTEIEIYIESIFESDLLKFDKKEIDGFKFNLIPIHILNNTLPLMLAGSEIQRYCI